MENIKRKIALIATLILLLSGCASIAEEKNVTESEFKTALSNLEIDDQSAGVTIDGFTEGLRIQTFDYDYLELNGDGSVGMKAYLYAVPERFREENEPAWSFSLGIYYDIFRDFSDGSVSLHLKSGNGTFDKKYKTRVPPLFYYQDTFAGGGYEHLDNSEIELFCRVVQAEKVVFTLTGADFSVRKTMPTDYLELFKSICTVHLGLKQGRKVSK